MEESVYNLIAPAQPAASTTYGALQGCETFPPAAGVRRSAARRVVPPTAITFGLSGTSAIVGNAGGELLGTVSAHPSKKRIGILGRPVGDAVSPSAYLRRNEGTLTASRGAPTAAEGFVRAERCVDVRKAPVPDRTDRPVLGMSTKKNFVVANAVENTLSVARKSVARPPPRAVDGEDFGKVPAYLAEIKSDLQRQYTMVDQYHNFVRQANERWSQLSAEELRELNAGLQRRWDSLNREYQSKGLSSVEAPSQKAHSEYLERELDALEVAMRLISKKTVFLFDDQK